ncbi:uncharacterized protein LOC110060680 [Orbicella faveolata]|uniref:uncharacterized protein LOC110060680 n=1 Tax=Orbicella faveolata TaxID=48498 RepID=UPI0009E3AE9E|nr:uncharacterized protein LOC110060680 [Orbicella faveolata]
MRPKELLMVLLAVFSFPHPQKGINAQEYYDLYSDNVFYRGMQREALTDPTSSGYLANTTVNYDSLVGHRASPTPIRVHIVITLVLILAVVLVIVVFWLIHLVRKRQRSSLRKEFAMTSEDAQLSSMALGDDPYESFCIPVPEDHRLTPQISLTSSAGLTTHLYP